MGGPPNQSKRDAKRVALGIRQTLRSVEDRRAQLLKRGVRQLHLPLDTDGLNDPKLPRSLACVLEQRGLADARLSMHHQDPAMPAARGLQ